MRRIGEDVYESESCVSSVMNLESEEIEEEIMCCKSKEAYWSISDW
jgi:hypothetical protein